MPRVIGPVTYNCPTSDASTRRCMHVTEIADCMQIQSCVAAGIPSRYWGVGINSKCTFEARTSQDDSNQRHIGLAYAVYSPNPSTRCMFDGLKIGHLLGASVVWGKLRTQSQRSKVKVVILPEICKYQCYQSLCRNAHVVACKVKFNGGQSVCVSYLAHHSKCLK
jgi:hypothetical protein